MGFMVLVSLIKKIGLPIVVLISIYLVNPFGLNFYFAYLIPILVLYQKDLLIANFDKATFILVLFSTIYALFYALNPTSGKQYIFLFALIPPSFYLLGKIAVIKIDLDPKLIFILFLTLGILHSFTALISVFSIYLREGFYSIDRNLPSFWNGQIIIATIMGSYFTLNMCIPSLLVVGNKRIKPIFGIVGLVLFLISSICVLKIGSRTQLAISVIALVFSFLYIIPRQTLRKNVITFLIIVITVYFFLDRLSLDFEQDWLSAFAGRMEEGGADDIASGGGRLDRWTKSFEYLFERPLGWPLEEFGHSHNLWLDVLRISGFIPFLLLIIFFYQTFKKVYRAIKKNKEEVALNNQIMVYSLAFLCLFMVEPIMEGMLELFALFCFIMGGVAAYCTPKQEKVLS
jgi:O-antigen ligase